MEPNSVTQNHGIDQEGERIRTDLLRPLFQTSWRFYTGVGVLVAIGLAGMAAFLYQTYTGMGVAGISRPVFWAFYITNFVFWIGISHAGTLISAILTRCAEAITVFALVIGGQFPIIHLGRPWLFFWLIPYPSERHIWPNFRSPLLWDFLAISTYITGSVTFLLLPIIPDWATVRDRATGLRKRIYTVLALGWQGTPREWHRLETAMRIMTIVIIPVAVSVHTIVSWDFAMALVPGWHSTVFGPYFVVGAIFSGIAALIVAMALIRKFLHLEEYLKPIHFDNLGKLLLLFSLLWLYFVFAERLTVWYGNETSEMAGFWSIQRGEFAGLFWTMVFCNFLLPFPILSIKKLRTITGTVIASSTVVIGMWLERFLIVVPPLEHKYLPYDWGSYHPTWVEITIMAGTAAGMVLFYLLFVKVVPIISMWELRGGEHPETAHSEAPVVLDQSGGARLDNTLPSTNG
jgi:Ni/Fe-hydrogenase subunit HybB-like protein